MNRHSSIEYEIIRIMEALLILWKGWNLTLQRRKPNGWWTGYDHLQFIANVQNLRTADMKAAAERIGTISCLDKKVGNYSLGMKQQLLLTMAILNKPI